MRRRKTSGTHDRGDIARIAGRGGRAGYAPTGSLTMTTRNRDGRNSL
jgi:hypothetical protein